MISLEENTTLQSSSSRSQASRLLWPRQQWQAPTNSHTATLSTRYDLLWTLGWQWTYTHQSHYATRNHPKLQLHGSPQQWQNGEPLFFSSKCKAKGTVISFQPKQDNLRAHPTTEFPVHREPSAFVTQGYKILHLFTLVDRWLPGPKAVKQQDRIIGWTIETPLVKRQQWTWEKRALARTAIYDNDDGDYCLLL